jgi:hypothetical protein
MCSSIKDARFSIKQELQFGEVSTSSNGLENTVFVVHDAEIRAYVAAEKEKEKNTWPLGKKSCRISLYSCNQCTI